MRAMVLCAGYGTRLGDLTESIPKPMLPLAGGRPLLEYIICNLARHGFREIAINLHFKPEQIRAYFGTGAPWEVEIFYSFEPELLGTAGALKKMASFLGAREHFLVHYGDILTDQDLGALRTRHERSRALATLLLHRRARSNSVVTMDPEGWITSFLERPTKSERPAGPVWVNSGVALCRRDLLGEIPPGPGDLPRDVFSRLAPKGVLQGFPLGGYRCAVDSPQRYRQALEDSAGGRVGL